MWRSRCGRDLGRALRRLGLVADHDLCFHRHHTDRIHAWQRLLDEHLERCDFHVEHGRAVWLVRASDNNGTC